MQFVLIRCYYDSVIDIYIIYCYAINSSSSKTLLKVAVEYGIRALKFFFSKSKRILINHKFSNQHLPLDPQSRLRRQDLRGLVGAQERHAQTSRSLPLPQTRRQPGN